MQTNKYKGGRPKLDPLKKSIAVLKFSARPFDVCAVEMIGNKRGLDTSNVVRYALSHLVDYEGLRGQVEEKATLLVSGAVSSAG